jgi:hypothetical protein
VVCTTFGSPIGRTDPYTGRGQLEQDRENREMEKMGNKSGEERKILRM